MRVLVVTLGMHAPWVDGRITSLRTLIGAWVAQGVKVQVMTTGPADLGRDISTEEGGAVYRLFPGGSRRNWYRWVRAFWTSCRRRDWDMVIFRPFAGFNRTNIAAVVVFRLICALRRVPFVLALWGGPEELLKVRRLFSSTFLVDGGYSHSGRTISLPPLVAVPPLAESAPDRAALQQWGVEEGDFVCLFTYCGKADSPALWEYIYHRRGLGDLIEAVAELRALDRLKIVVSMPLFASSEVRTVFGAKLRSKGVEARFILVPEIGDLGAVLPAVDAYLYPIDLDEVSWAPLSILEAFACGTPVITTRIPAIQRYVGDDEALLFTPGHPRELAELLRRLHGERGFAKVLRRNAHRKLAAYDSRGQAAFVCGDALKRVGRANKA